MGQGSYVNRSILSGRQYDSQCSQFSLVLQDDHQCYQSIQTAQALTQYICLIYNTDCGCCMAVVVGRTAVVGIALDILLDILVAVVDRLVVVHTAVVVVDRIVVVDSIVEQGIHTVQFGQVELGKPAVVHIAVVDRLVVVVHTAVVAVGTAERDRHCRVE